MNTNEKLLKILKYSKGRLHHPEDKNVYHYVGDTAYPPPLTSLQLKDQYERRLKSIEEWEFFRDNIDELIKEIEKFLKP